MGRGLIVLGTHRSGTSAVTGAIDALGLRACRTGDRFPARRWNERGNYESRSLTKFDESLLRHVGGAWWAPPNPAAGWADNEGMGRLRDEAALLFAAAHPFDEWVWKDPRACVLLPFWDLVLGGHTPRMVVLRHPLEIAGSLEARNHMPRGLALALGERNLRLAFRDSAGRPVMVTAYDEALDDVAAWCHEVATFIRLVGLSLPEPLAVDAAREFLDPSLRHHRGQADPGQRAITPGLRRLWDWAYGRRGIHPSLSIEGLPEESPDVDPQIRAALSYQPINDPQR